MALPPQNIHQCGDTALEWHRRELRHIRIQSPVQVLQAVRIPYLVEKGLVDCLKGAVKSSPPGQLCKDFQDSSPIRAAAALHVPLHVLRHHIVDAAVEQGTGLPGDSRQIRQPFHA
ncbi:MAG: hypothetical protein ACLVD1_04545 [Lacrimispora saccharolytica]